MQRALLLLFIVCYFALSQVFAGSAGTTSARILQITADARASALGNSYCALADDLGAAYWNPAGLSNIHNKELAFSYADLYQEFKFSHLAYAHPLSNNTTVLGIGISYLDSGEIQRTLASSRGFYIGNDGTFKGTSSVLTFSVASTYSSHWFSGINIKQVQETIDTSSAQSFTMDVGLLYKTLSDRLSLGFSASNLFGSLKLSDESESLPLIIKLGSSMNFKYLLLAADISKVSDSELSFHLGAEYPLAKIFMIRAGFDSLSESKFTTGFGLKLGKQSFDYAFVQSKYLGLTHKLSMGIKFGANKPREQKIFKNSGDLWYFK